MDKLHVDAALDLCAEVPILGQKCASKYTHVFPVKVVKTDIKFA